MKQEAAIKAAGVFILHFHFDDLPDNLVTSLDAFIHAGFNLMKPLWRLAPHG